ncbi:MAG TPA: hypothetical protein VF559_08820 [Caulobacteraceae bacterium]|jgi:rod shape-determining protein MreD
MGFPGAQRLDPLSWLVLPMLLALAAAVLFTLPLRLFGLQLPEPVWPLAPAFAWAMIRPSVIAPFLVLLMGLFLDFLWGGPSGLWGFSILFGFGFILLARSMMIGQSLVVLWSWFGLMSVLVFAAAYLLTMLDSGSRPDLFATGLQLLPTLLLYPLAHQLIERFEDADVRFR